MALSVGLARIVNDPDAPIRTRQALGRLATPGLLVNDQGITINTDGRIVLRLSSGLSETTTGLSVKVKSGGGIVSGDDGLALDDPLGDITFTNITVNQNANITGNVNVAGAVNVIGPVTTPVINSGTITNTGDIHSGTATIVGNASVGGTFTGVVINAGSMTVSGNASVDGTLTAGSANITVGLFAGAAVISGALTAGSASVSGNASVAGTLSSLNATVTGSATINSINCTTGSFNNFGCVTSNTTGNATIGGNLTVTGTITGGGSGAITPTSVRINGGTTIIRVLSFFVSLFINPVGSGSQDNYITVSGAVFGDMAICSPLVVLPVGILSWSAMVTGTNQVCIRTSRGLTSGSATVDFRVTIIGFA